MAPATAMVAASAARSMAIGGALPLQRPRNAPGDASLAATATPRPRASWATGSSNRPGPGPRRRLA
eukprot:9163035-Heterocapsa_arctica.AAC.1